MKKIGWGLVLLGVFKLIYLIIWAYNYEPPLNESRKFLNRTTEEAEVYIDPDFTYKPNPNPIKP